VACLSGPDSILLTVTTLPYLTLSPLRLPYRPSLSAKSRKTACLQHPAVSTHEFPGTDKLLAVLSTRSRTKRVGRSDKRISSRASSITITPPLPCWTCSFEIPTDPVAPRTLQQLLIALLRGQGREPPKTSKFFLAAAQPAYSSASEPTADIKAGHRLSTEFRYLVGSATQSSLITPCRPQLLLLGRSPLL
jgi:hypothetical protein